MINIINRAIEGGFNWVDFCYVYMGDGQMTVEKGADVFFDWDSESLLIFDIDFLKAFFGVKDYICTNCNSIQHTSEGGYCVSSCLGERSIIPMWQFEAQQYLPLDPPSERIKYLNKYVKEQNVNNE